MTPEQAKALRAPFPPEAIGKLPRPTRKENPKGKCKDCGGWHGLPAVHLDYVGHAATTDRLLQVDAKWTWEPMARDAHGFPLLDAKGGLWINLTVAGVTRPGYGDDTMGHGMKEVIGDALRNAAMRFGVALDLWSKEDLRGGEDPTEPPATKASEAKPKENKVPAADDEAARKKGLASVHAKAAEKGLEHGDVALYAYHLCGVETMADLTVDQLRAVYRDVDSGKAADWLPSIS